MPTPTHLVRRLFQPDARRSASLRWLVTVMLVATMLLTSGLTTHAQPSGWFGRDAILAPQEPPHANVTVVIHSCPDDLDAVTTGFYQYATRCNLETGRYGVPLGLTSPRRPAVFQYSRPETNAALTWEPRTGTVTIAEVVALPRGPVVFCSLQPKGNVPPTMDGAEVPVAAGVLSIDLADGDALRCDWYRFPGPTVPGESVDPEPSISPSPSNASSPSPLPSGAAILIRPWVCESPGGLNLSDQDIEATQAAQERTGQYNEQLPYPVGTSGNAETDHAALVSLCQVADRPFDYRIVGETIQRKTLSITGIDGYRGLHGQWVYVIQAVPRGYGLSWAFCQSQPNSPSGSPGPWQAIAPRNNEMVYILGNDEVLTCDWFNVRPDRSVSPSPSPSPSPQDSALMISAWQCPAAKDPAQPIADGTCTEPIDGLTFGVTGPNGFQSQSDTGDSRTGAVVFAGIEPGSYGVTGENTGALDPVLDCGAARGPVGVPDGDATIEVPPGTEVFCDWFVPAEPDDLGLPDPDASIDPHNGNTQDPTNDLDNDGLIDTK